MAEQQQQQSRVTTSMYEDMQYWQERCSICFDNHLDFCLNRCRDQFCRHCFNRYIGELVKSYWGMSVAKVKCPVCYDPLHANEWSKASFLFESTTI
jgi:hypothetical protein